VKNKTSAISAATFVALGTIMLGASPALAANRVCHNGSTLQPPVRIQEEGGWTYTLYPGKCTSGLHTVVGWSPRSGCSCLYKFYGDTYYKRAYYNGHWYATVGRSISIYSCRYEYGIE
jgi:hypothetical protein